MDKETVFEYTYSAGQQDEVKKIREKYLPPKEDKMATLRKLDRIPNQKAQAWAIALGVIGALVLGTGMSLVMTDFGAWLGQLALAVGILVGLVGMVLVALAYPAYNHILQKECERIAPEVLRLTDELMQ